MQCTLPVGIATLIASHALAVSSWDFTLLPSSTAVQSMTVNYPLAGTFIGNYDAATNPTGTRTLPGLFGGSGNNAIPYTATTRVTDSINSHPAGDFTLALSSPGACEVTGLVCDLVNGTPGTVNADLILTYSTFHTVAPSSIYPSLGPVTIPLTSGTVTSAVGTQSGPAIGTAIPNPDGTYAITVVVPIAVTVAGSAGGQPFPTDPTAAALTLTGTLTVTASGATLASTAQSTDPIGPLPPPPPLVNMPVSLPTVPPGATTANLLFSGTFGEGNGTSSITLNLAASGAPTSIPGDINGDGVVDGLDLTALMSAWGTSGSPADLTGDGTVDGFDLTALFSYWTV
jgi:hypothetical protein